MGVTFCAVIILVLPTAEGFTGTGTGVVVAANPPGLLNQHSARETMRGGGKSGTLMTLFWPRASSMGSYMHEGEGDKKVRRVLRGQGENEVISIRTMADSDMDGADSKLIEVCASAPLPTRLVRGCPHRQGLDLARSPQPKTCACQVAGPVHPGS